MLVCTEYRARKAIAPKKNPARILHPGALPCSCSITLLTSLVGENRFTVSYRTESNTQLDFIAFLETTIEEGTLCPGDYLIVDNAAVHVGLAYIETTYNVLRCNEIQMVTLPTYSPELNPCENVFGLVKNYYRSEDAWRWDPEAERYISYPFRELLIRALDTITDEILENFYRGCLNPKSI